MKKFTVFFAAMVVAIASFSTVHGQHQYVAETALDFGCVAPGATSEEVFTISATLTEEVTYLISLTGPDAANFKLIPGNLGGSVDPNATLDYCVEYTGTLSGEAEATLTIGLLDSNNPDPVTIALNATCGTPESLCTFIKELLEFFDASIAGGTLESTGPQGNRRYRAFRNRIKAIDFLIQNGYVEHARYITCTAIERSDGDSNPKDFVQGPALQELNDRLVFLKFLLE